jgi:hypothetical protein
VQGDPEGLSAPNSTSNVKDRVTEIDGQFESSYIEADAKKMGSEKGVDSSFGSDLDIGAEEEFKHQKIAVFKNCKKNHKDTVFGMPKSKAREYKRASEVKMSG